MPRDISLTRQEAELIVSVLMLTDEWPASDIDRELREQWGMGSQSDELTKMGKTIEQVRTDWANKILNKQNQ